MNRRELYDLLAHVERGCRELSVTPGAKFEWLIWNDLRKNLKKELEFMSAHGLTSWSV